MITYLLHTLYIIQQTLCLYEYPWLPNQSHLFPEMLHLCQIMEKSMFSMGCHVKLVMYSWGQGNKINKKLDTK